MQIERLPADRIPFGSESTGVTDVARVLGGETASNLAAGESAKRARARIERWVTERGLPSTDGAIVLTHENILGRGGPTTGDASFDRRYVLTASDVEAMRVLLDDAAREAIRDIGAWCRIRYDQGAIEVLVDDEALAPSHLIDAMHVAFALARPRKATAAYR